MQGGSNSRQPGSGSLFYFDIGCRVYLQSLAVEYIFKQYEFLFYFDISWHRRAPFFYFDGKFLGMNFYHEYSGGSSTPRFYPGAKILQVVESFKTKRYVRISFLVFMHYVQVLSNV